MGGEGRGHVEEEGGYLLLFYFCKKKNEIKEGGRQHLRAIPVEEARNGLVCLCYTNA